MRNYVSCIKNACANRTREKPESHIIDADLMVMEKYFDL